MNQTSIIDKRRQLNEFMAPEANTAAKKIIKTLRKENYLKFCEEAVFFKSVHEHCLKMSSKLFIRSILQELQIASKEKLEDYESLASSPDSILSIRNNLRKHYRSLFSIWEKQVNQYTNVLKLCLANFESVRGDLLRQFFPEFLECEEDFYVRDICIAGDRHNDGISTCIFNTTTGKVVFKPRRIANDQLFNEVSRIIGHNESKQTLQITSTTGSFHRFLHSKRIETNDILLVNNFFEKLGELIAICVLLQIEDIHYENIFCVDGVPTLVDLECLFTPDNSKFEVRDTAYKRLAKICLLPNFTTDETAKVFDRSGMKPSYSYSKTRTPMLSFDDEFPKIAYTDSVQLSASILPIFNGEEVSISDFKRPTLNGFNKACNLLLANKRKIELAFEKYSSNLLSRFVARNTSLYTKLISLSYHPDYHYGGDKREALFERLPKNEFITNEILQFEIVSMLKTDVPIYTYDSEGVLCIDNKKVNSPPAQSFRQSLQNNFELLEFTKDELVHYIDLFFSQEIYKNAKSRQSYQVQFLDSKFNQSLEFISKNKSIVNVDAIHNFTQIKDIGYSLYGGRLGLIYAAFMAGRLSNKDLGQTLNPIQHCIFEENLIDVMTHGFSGIGGVLWIFEKMNLSPKKAISKLVKDRLIKDCSAYLNGEKNTEVCDFLQGLLGTALVVINHCELSKKQKGLINAVIAKHLLENAIPPSGFAHGGFLILKISTLLKTEKSLESKLLNDLRQVYFERVYEKDTLGSAWCKGDLPLLDILLEDVDNKILAEKLIKKHNHKIKLVVTNDCICHGRIGTQALIWSIKRKLRILGLKCSFSIEQQYNYVEEEFTSGIYRGFYNIGLFSGYAGHVLESETKVSTIHQLMFGQ